MARAFANWFSRKWLALWLVGGLSVLVALAVADVGKAVDVLRITIEPMALLAGGLMGVHKVADSWVARSNNTVGGGE